MKHLRHILWLILFLTTAAFLVTVISRRSRELAAEPETASAAAPTPAASAEHIRVVDDEIYDAWGNKMGWTDSYYLKVYDRYGTFVDELVVGLIADGKRQQVLPDVNAVYDERGNLLYFGGVALGEGFSNYSFSYDGEDRIVSAVSSLESFNLTQRWITEVSFTYGEDGTVTRLAYFPPRDGAEGLGDTITIVYSPERLPRSRVDVDLDSGLVTYEESYDEAGRPLWLRSYVDGELDRESEYVYVFDERGNLIEERYIDNGVEQYVRTYTPPPS